MSEPFLAEIRIVSFNFAPKGWAMCNGQLLPINQNQALFSILGTTYGGNGTTNFALPNLQGRAPMHANGVHPLGQSAGEEAHTLTIPEMPAHGHALMASTAAVSPATTTNAPSGHVLGKSTSAVYESPVNLTTLNPLSVGTIAASQPHDNMAPFLTLNFIIALQGIFPSRN